MTMHDFCRKSARALVVLGLSALLTSCLFAPGKFASELDLHKDGSFSFDYHGEIYLLALSSLAELNKPKKFEAQPCYDDDYNERDCTSAELKQQHEEWDAQQPGKSAEDKRNAQAMQTLLGGIDPSDPKAAQEIADRLSRQKGWSNVAYEGNGLLTADFSISGTMDHDFVFPVFEGFPMSNSFVIATLRDGNAVRIEAPGFTGQSFTGNPMSGMLEAVEAGKKAKQEDEPAPPKLDGTFTIVTDGTILTNNTDQGPQPMAGGQKLSWSINSRTTSAPVALIRLGD